MTGSGQVGWAGGRLSWLPASAWLLTVLVVYALWWVGGSGPWSPFEDQHYVWMNVLAPVVAGSIAAYGILPRVDWVDQQAVTRPQWRDTVALALLLVAFSVVPLLARWLLSLGDAYLFFAPEGTQSSVQFLDPNFVAASWRYSLDVATVLAAMCLLVAVVGRRLGPLTGPACLLALLYMQGYRLAPAWFPRVDDPSDWRPAALVAALVVGGLAAFRLSSSGARPLIR